MTSIARPAAANTAPRINHAAAEPDWRQVGPVTSHVARDRPQLSAPTKIGAVEMPIIAAPTPSGPTRRAVNNVSATPRTTTITPTIGEETKPNDSSDPVRNQAV